MFERRHSNVCALGNILVQVVGVWDGFAVRSMKMLEKEKTLMVGIWALGSLSICLNSDPAEKILDISNMYCLKIILGVWVYKGW